MSVAAASLVVTIVIKYSHEYFLFIFRRMEKLVYKSDTMGESEMAPDLLLYIVHYFCPEHYVCRA